MNPGLHELNPYPFERLAEIRQRISPPTGLDLINLSIGEPQQQTPALIHAALVANLEGFARYPATRGIGELREAICAWATRRFELAPTALQADRNVLPVNGTREALFAIAQTLVHARSAKSLVGMPNPFYQIYEGAALLSGGQPYYLPCPSSNEFRPQWDLVPVEIWQQMAMLYICSPSNPAGSVLGTDDYATLLALADKHDFVIIADECYSELYFDEQTPPLGLLQWCAQSGRESFARCLVMHSLSKRSNAPGLRSGFVAGDAALIDTFYRYRTYQGGAMALPIQHASIAAWSDESHVTENRKLYRAKFTAVAEILRQVMRVDIPCAGFYLWPELPLDDIVLCERLLGEAGVLVLPGQFLARDVGPENPGRNRIRIALVADQAQCVSAALRICAVLKESLNKS
jgi:N-succinyldiaminopimelate aminotransferase